MRIYDFQLYGYLRIDANFKNGQFITNVAENSTFAVSFLVFFSDY